MKKIIGFGICMLLITLVLPTTTADVESLITSEDDVEINISAGFRGKDIGFTIAVDILNHKTEDVNVIFNLTFDYLIQNALDGTYELNYTVQPELPCYAHISPVICYPDGIKFISITVEAEGTMVSRNGFSIRNLVILFSEK